MAVSEFDLGPELGLVRRLWPEITAPNLLCITVQADRAVFDLEVLPLEEGNAGRRLVLD